MLPKHFLNLTFSAQETNAWHEIATMRMSAQHPLQAIQSQEVKLRTRWKVIGKIERTETCPEAHSLLLSVSNLDSALGPAVEEKQSVTGISVLLAVRLMEKERKPQVEPKTWWDLTLLFASRIIDWKGPRFFPSLLDSRAYKWYFKPCTALQLVWRVHMQWVLQRSIAQLGRSCILPFVLKSCWKTPLWVSV